MYKSVLNYEKAIYNIADEFVYRFMGDDIVRLDSVRGYYYLVGDKNTNMLPGPICINDEYYFSIDDAYCVLVNDIPNDILLKWYNEVLDAGMKDETIGVNLYNYYLLNKKQ